MSNIEKKSLELIEPIYAAATDRRLWPQLIKAISDVVGGGGGMLRLIDYSNRRVGFFDAVGYDPQYVQAYRDYFITIDPLREYFENVPVGSIKSISQLHDASAILNSEFYNDYVYAQGKGLSAGATLARDDNATIQFSIHRDLHSGDFGQKEIQILRLLLPHITRAVQVHRLIGETSALADMACASLDRARVGILHINREGENLLAAGNISVAQKRLILSNPGDTSKLHQLIASAAVPALGKALLGGGDMKLCSSSGNVDLELRVIPMPCREMMTDFSMHTGGVAVFVSHPGSLQLPWKRVASSYGLSTAEAKLAVILAEGFSLEEAADRLFVSINTVRTQLKSVFAKTGVRRQSELVAVLLSGILAWCKDEEDE